MSGKGRGRGWLNINNPPIVQPGFNTNEIGKPASNKEEWIDNFKAVTVNTQLAQHPKLVLLIEQLDINDDGILLNQKFKPIIKYWQSECNSDIEVKDSLKYVYSKCLEDANLASKFMHMMSTYSFNKQIFHDVKIKNILVSKLQDDYESREQLQHENPVAFRNRVQMFVQFFFKEQLASGSYLSCLKTALLDYLEMLLESSQAADLELFTCQLHLNGKLLKEEQVKIQQILMKVRHLLLNKSNLSQLCRSWMLLSLDSAYNNFETLPDDVYKFYEDQLGEKFMTNFKGKYDKLTIQTSHSNKLFDDYQSNVNVLQVTPPESSSAMNNQISDDWDVSNVKKQEKVGRPILGTGIHLQTNIKNNTNHKNQKKVVSFMKNNEQDAWENGKQGFSNRKKNISWDHDGSWS